MLTEIFDPFIWTKENKTLIHARHQIPGLGNFTYQNTTVSAPPSPLHFHKNMLEIHIMIKGQRTSIIGDSTLHQFQSYTYAGNSMFLIFPSEIHGNGSLAQLPCEFYALQIDLSDPRHLLYLNEDGSQFLYTILTHNKIRQLEFSKEQLSLLKSAFKHISTLHSSDIKIGAQFLTSFLFCFEMFKPMKETGSIAKNQQIYKSIAYLKEHLADNIQLNELANISGYSLSHYKQKFKQEVGITPSEYITLQKLDFAKALLTENQKSITEIAFLLGFSSSNYFCSVFKKYTNYTPSEYKKTFIH